MALYALAGTAFTPCRGNQLLSRLFVSLVLISVTLNPYFTAMIIPC